MAPVSVKVKHQGKTYDIDIDDETTGEIFKAQLSSLTDVEPERQKIIVKGGQLKDDTLMSSLKPKSGQVFMMIGTPSAVASASTAAPTDKIRFVEDMSNAEAAQLEGAMPAGLQNLGNTCYLNSALQVFRSIPELGAALQAYKDNSQGSARGQIDLAQFGLGNLGGSMDMTGALRDLYKQMGETQQGFPPILFLNALRQSFEQFSQKAKDGHGFAQQDAEEAWSVIVETLRGRLKMDGTTTASGSGPRGDSWIDNYMAGTFEQVLTCDDESAKEDPITTTETFLKLTCNISVSTNHLREGIEISLNEKLDKRSPSLNREATYSKVSRISRLPRYLPVHLVRFFWKQDAGKKAKIMRKVTFPAELDVVEFCTEDLKKKLIPVRNKIRELRKEEEEIERAKKRQKRMQKEKADEDAVGIVSEPITKKSTKANEIKTDEATSGDKMEGVESTEKFKTDKEIEAERHASILAAKKDLLAAVDPSLAADKSACQSGLYELRGLITHQGASADSGHYTAYIKKAGPKGKDGRVGPEDGAWWWFNDEKVSEVPAEKIQTLAGGGESHSAFVLLYRAVTLPSKEEVDAEAATSEAASK